MRHYLEHLEETFRNHWSEPGVVTYGGDSFTFGQMAAHIASLQLFFKAAGIGSGDQIALCAKNTSRWAISFLAINTSGAVVVPILSDFTPEGIMKLVDHSDSALLFTDNEHFEHLDLSLMPKIRAIVSTDDFCLLYSASPELATCYNKRNECFAANYPDGLKSNDLHFNIRDLNELAIINYTSGTSSEPKGVMLSYGNISASVDYAHRHVDVYPTDTIVSMLPQAHIYGLVFEFIYPLTGGCTVYFLGRTPAPTLLLKAMREVRPYMICTVPLVIEKIYRSAIKPVVSRPGMKILLTLPGISNMIRNKIRAKLDEAFGGQVRHYIMGGAALNHEVDHWFGRLGLHYTVGYGMTEAAPLLAYIDWRDYRQGSCGRAVDCADVRIANPDPTTGVGEIQAKGDNICLGYYKNEAATAAAFTADGFLHTGDLGTIDSDGNIFIKGRSKNMILSPNGQNIYPEEIEAVVAGESYVAENLVVERDNKLVALVYLNPDTLAAHGIEGDGVAKIGEQVLSAANRTLPAYSQLARVELRDKPFEKTPKMSIKRFLYS